MLLFNVKLLMALLLFKLLVLLAKCVFFGWRLDVVEHGMNHRKGEGRTYVCVYVRLFLVRTHKITREQPRTPPAINFSGMQNGIFCFPFLNHRSVNVGRQPCKRGAR